MSALDKAIARVRKVARVDEYRRLHDIEAERQRQALSSTAAFVDERMAASTPVSGENAVDAKYRVLEMAVDLAPAEGLVLEFGVNTGDTLRRIAAKRSPAHGFDSFEGLPEIWRTGYGAGHFARDLPEVPGAELHVGWFDDTLGPFLDEHPGPIALVHLDADLYSSTATVFREAGDRIVPGTVLLFDEYFNYPGWQQHEHKAFMEFVEKTGHTFEYVAFNSLHEQVLVRITG